MDSNLGEFEQLVLLALMRLGDNAYGVTVRRELEQRAHRRASLGTVYKALERLENKGLVSSRICQPTAERGGRRKKLYRPSSTGIQALRRSMTALRSMSEGMGEQWEAP